MNKCVKLQKHSQRKCCFFFFQKDHKIISSAKPNSHKGTILCENDTKSLMWHQLLKSSVNIVLLLLMTLGSKIQFLMIIRIV